MLAGHTELTDKFDPFKDKQSRIWGTRPVAPVAVQPTKYGQELSLCVCVCVCVCVSHWENQFFLWQMVESQRQKDS